MVCVECPLLLVASLLLVAMPRAPSSVLATSSFFFLVAMLFVPISFLLLVVMPMPGATSRVLAPNTNGLQPTSDGLQVRENIARWTNVRTRRIQECDARHAFFKLNVFLSKNIELL